MAHKLEGLNLKNSILFYSISILMFLMLIGCKQKTVIREITPNVIIIFTDDQGYADLGCYGAKDFETPNIDKLAEEGMRFTSFYVTEAVCSASRSSLLTGCYAQRIGIRGALSPFTMTGLNREEVTIASMLKQQGYKTGMVGKWHLGSIPEFYPTNYGFDEYLGLLYSNDMWSVGYDGNPLTEGYRSSYPPLGLMNGDSVVRYLKTLEDQEMLTSLYTETAIDFIEKNAAHPFFLYVAHSMVHVPLAVSDKFEGSSVQGLYGDVMREIDWSVGEIRKALERNGITDNTLIIFTSDNGPWLNFGNHAGSAYPLREGKGNAWEGGVRVPCIMSFPGLISRSSETDLMASTIDLLPTIAALTNSTLPEKDIDGVDILHILKGNMQANPRNEFIYYYEGGLCAVRRGDWKLVLPHNYRSYADVEPGKDGYPGPYSKGIAGLELYNLKDDVGETTDVKDLHPEIVDQMLTFADSTRYALGDRFKSVKGKHSRSPGRVRCIQEVIDHKARDRKYELTFSPNPRYPGGSEFALTDGYRASLEFSDESWVGFQGEDLEIIIDLGHSRDLRTIEINFLQNQPSWIFLPEIVQLYFSEDNDKFEIIDEAAFSSAENNFKIDTHKYKYSGSVQARFVKVLAKNLGQCPDWHPGKNNPSWLFVDEIIVK